jgi:serine/threonine protein kinase
MFNNIMSKVEKSAKAAMNQAQSKYKQAMGTDIILTFEHQNIERVVRVKDLIAEGGYAFVYTAEEVNTGQLFALKRMLIQDDETMKCAQMEIQIMRKLSNAPYVIQFLGSHSRTIDRPECTELFVLMELCTGGNLMDFINKRNKRPFEENELCSIFHQIVIGVSHLHLMKPPVAHRDLKIENILIGGHHEMKLCDFGSCTTRAQKYVTSKDISQEEERIQKYSTSMYRAPEMVDLYKKEMINEKVDIWALGCILYTLAFFTHPFQEGGNLQIISGSYNMPENHKYSKYFLSLLKKLFTMKSAKRPDIKQVLTMMDMWSDFLKKKGMFMQNIQKPNGIANGKKKASESEEESEDDDSEEESEEEEPSPKRKTAGRPSSSPKGTNQLQVTTPKSGGNGKPPTPKSGSQTTPNSSLPATSGSRFTFPTSASPPPAPQRSSSGSIFDLSAFGDSFSSSSPPPPSASGHGKTSPIPIAAGGTAPVSIGRRGRGNSSSNLIPLDKLGGVSPKSTVSAPQTAQSKAAADAFGALSFAVQNSGAAKPAPKTNAPVKTVKKKVESSSEEDSDDDSDDDDSDDSDDSSEESSDDEPVVKKKPVIKKPPPPRR